MKNIETTNSFLKTKALTTSYEASIDVIKIFKDWIENNRGWDVIQKASSKNREKTLQRLFHLGTKYYLEKRKQPYMPMHEHVNFFTPKSLRALLEKTGLKVLDVQENFEKAVLGKSLVLSAFCKK